MDCGNTDDFQAVKLLYDTAMLDTCHYPFVQTHRTHNTKTEPTNVNYGCWPLWLHHM